MTQTYYPDTTDRDTYLTGFLYEKNLASTQGASSSLTLAVPASATASGMWTTDANQPGATSWNGTYTLHFDVTASGTDLTINSATVRGINASLSGASSPAWNDSVAAGDWDSRTGTGLKTAVAALAYSVDPQMSTTDRAVLQVYIGNSSSMKAEDWVIAVGAGSSTDFTAPWSATVEDTRVPARNTQYVQLLAH